MPLDFWCSKHFDLNDALNREIWGLSPSVQECIDPPSALLPLGAIGAQQAMIPCGSNQTPPLLPWVPDIVGMDWKSPSSLLIVGSAYAGFIREFSGRSGCMSLADYTSARTAQEFQEAFLESVVRGDRNYYGPIADLCDDIVPAQQISVFDLCRVSLVKRASVPTGRSDSSKATHLRTDSTAYSRYCETSQAADWLWRRIVDGAASSIVALGTVAEHGLLRLFTRRGMSVRDETHLWESPKSTSWAAVYADSNRKLSHWLNNGRWWQIDGIVNNVARSWRLLPAYHPASRATTDPDYAKTKRLLNQMRSIA